MHLVPYYMQLAGLIVGVIAARWVLKDKWLEELCLVGIAGNAMLAMLIRYQDTGNLAWWLIAMGVVVTATPWLRRLQGKIGLMGDRRERRALMQLFGEPTLADMLLRDTRLESFKARR